MTTHLPVAVTGIGLVTPLGLDAPSSWRKLLAGDCGVGPIAAFDASGFPVRIAAEVEGFDPAASGLAAKRRKLANRDHLFALAAAHEALRDAGTRPAAATAARWGCVVGAGMMSVGYDELLRFQRAAAPHGIVETSRIAAGEVAADPIGFARNQANAGLALLVEELGIHGYASAVHTACASGGQAIETALDVLRRGDADVVLAGGFDSMIHPVGLAGFCLLGALSTDNETPLRASRPFDRTRNGFVLGEGAGFLVLESMTAARRRGARVYAELAGAASTLSAYRITDSHPSGDGAIQALHAALRDAAMQSDEIDYVNAHGTSTPMNDRSECAALRAVFGAHGESLAVSSTKGQSGHLIAAAGAVEAAFTALAVAHQVAPVNANLSEPDPDCGGLSFVTGAARALPIRAALSNSFGFGGSNSCLVLRRSVEGG